MDVPGAVGAQKGQSFACALLKVRFRVWCRV